MQPTYENVFDLITAQVPEFQELYDEHIEDNDELLQHVLSGDLTRFVISKFEKWLANDDRLALAAVECILSILEEGMTSPDEDLQELIVLSFLANLEYRESYYEELKAKMGPALSKQLKVMTCPHRLYHFLC